MDISNYVISWTDLIESVNHIRLYLQKIGKHKPKAIIFVARGGMVPGCMLANQLGVKRVLMVSASSYNESRKRGSLQLLLPSKEDTAEFDTEQGADIVVVDDLVDTGTTFHALRKMWPKATYVCLLKKPEGSDAAHFAPLCCPQNTWVHFPWE